MVQVASNSEACPHSSVRQWIRIKMTGNWLFPEKTFKLQAICYSTRFPEKYRKTWSVSKIPLVRPDIAIHRIWGLPGLRTTGTGPWCPHELSDSSQPGRTDNWDASWPTRSFLGRKETNWKFLILPELWASLFHRHTLACSSTGSQSWHWTRCFPGPWEIINNFWGKTHYYVCCISTCFKRYCVRFGFLTWSTSTEKSEPSPRPQYIRPGKYSQFKSRGVVFITCDLYLRQSERNGFWQNSTMAFHPLVVANIPNQHDNEAIQIWWLTSKHYRSDD